MFMKLLLLFTIVPLVELYLLVEVGQEIGTLNTIAIVVITGIAGASFAKSQGAQVIRNIRETSAQGQIPGRELVEGAMVLAAGVMLITPGFITDILGLSLLIPFTRKFYTDITINYFRRKFEQKNQGQPPEQGPYQNLK
ncbi:MAG: FxsA family protein [bacterium]|nr:FxsA family protein [bacterium]